MKSQYKLLSIGIASIAILSTGYASGVYAQTYNAQYGNVDRNGYYFGSGYLIPSIQPIAPNKEIIETLKIGEEKTITLDNIFTNLPEIRKYFAMTFIDNNPTIAKFVNTGTKEIPADNIIINDDGEGTITIDKNMTTESGEYKLDISVCSEGRYTLQEVPQFNFIPVVTEVEIEDEE